MVYDYTSEDRTGMRYLELFDQVPPLGRGLSWTVQLEDIFS